MANNPYVNKVQFGSQTLIDLTSDTVTAEQLMQGYTAHDRTGALITGTATGGSGDGYVWQDGNGYVHLSDEQGTQTIIDALTVDASGTYTAPTGHAYSPVTIPSGSATTPTTSISVTPSISVNSSGLITASASGSKSITPTVSSGWVSSGTAGTVSVSGSNTSQLSTQAAKTVTPTETSQTAVAAGKYTTGNVTVGAISSTYVGSGITQRSSSDLTASGATVTVPSGYYSEQATKTVASGTAGTPTASKGTVSNHSISVTPSVTNSTGYIIGGTKTGTAVTVSASELVSGTLTISSSGTKDVTNYASASVASGTEGTPIASKGAVSNHSISVTPSVTNSAGYISGGAKTGTAVTVSASELVSGSQTVTENDTYDVSNLSEMVVNVPSGSAYTLVASEDFTVNTTSTTATEVGTVNLTANEWTGDKIIYVKIRDKAGERNGYFLGSDAFIINVIAANNSTSTLSNFPRSIITRYYSYATNLSTTYGVYTSSIKYEDGIAKVVISSAYNSGISRTINGTYNVSVYTLDYAPDQGNPFDYSY